MNSIIKSTTLTILLSTFSLLNIVINTQKTSAQPDPCRQIRAVRQLAFQENLDGRNLATLEARYCNNNQDHQSTSSEIDLPPENASKDCLNLTVMKRLANMTTTDNNLINMIKENVIALQKDLVKHKDFGIN